MRRPILFGFFACAVAAGVAAQTPRPRIVFVGDSITEGTVTRPSFRQPLWELLHGAGYCFDFVGSRRGVVGGRPPRLPSYDLDHFGISGETSFEMCFELLAPLPQFEADVAVVQLGTNDVIKGHVFYGLPPQAIGQMADQFLRTLVTLLHSPPYDPNLEIVIAKVPPLPSVIVRTPELNLPPGPDIVGLDLGILAVNRAIHTLGSLPGVRVVDLHTGFDPVLHLADQVHPNSIGEAFIANRMFGVLSQILPAPSPGSACFTEYGKGVGGDDPTLGLVQGTVAPQLGSTFGLAIRNLKPLAPVVLVIGLQRGAIPLDGIDEFLFVDPTGYAETNLIGQTSAGGDLDWTVQLPGDLHLAGLEIFVQALAFSDGSVATASSGAILRLGN